MDRHVSHRPETRLVGTDPGELLDGERVGEFLRGEAQAMGGAVTIDAGEPEAYRDGSVGWALARPTITLPEGTQISPRWSAVFHEEDGEWRLVQLHASVGIPNEELLGMELPA